MAALLHALQRGLPVGVGGNKKAVSADLVAAHLGKCLAKHPHLPADEALLECLRPVNLWPYYRYAEELASEVERWVVFKETLRPLPFPDAPSGGYARYEYLFGSLYAKEFLRCGYWWTLLANGVVSPKHEGIVRSLALCREVPKRQERYMRHLYEGGV